MSVPPRIPKTPNVVPKLPSLAVGERTHQPPGPYTLPRRRFRETASPRRMVGVPVETLSAAKGVLTVVDGAMSGISVRESTQGAELRDKLVDWLGSCEKEGTTFASPTLLCRSMISNLCSQDITGVDDRTQPHILRSAAAFWALDILIQTSPTQLSDTLRFIRDELLMTSFVNYTPPSAKQEPPRPASTTAVQTPSAQLDMCRSLLNKNPFLSHDFYFQHYTEYKGHLNRFEAHATKLGDVVSRSMSAVERTAKRWEDKFVHVVFIAWRSWHRKKKRERYIKSHRLTAGAKWTERLLLQSCLVRWKMNVEVSRNVMLRERENELMFQIDNAKNQFQLQCFRADKYLRTIEEVRTELSIIRDERNHFKAEAKRLQKEIDEYDESSRKELNARINEILKELAVWRDFARVRVDNKLHDATQDNKFNADELSKTLEPTASTRNLLTEDEEDMKEFKENQNVAERALLNWVNAVARDSVVSVGRVTNFRQDFANGEVMLILLHRVFPRHTPFTALQETDIPKRLEIIYKLCVSVGVANLPKPQDIIDGFADLMVMFVSELFVKFMQRRRFGKEMELKATQSMRVMAESANPATAFASEVDVFYDVDMLPMVLTECENEMQQLLETEQTALEQEREVLDYLDEVQRHAGHLTRERLSGNPVYVMDVKEMMRYCRIQKARFQDLEWKYRTAPEDMKREWVEYDDQLDELKRVLKRHYVDIRKIFQYYSGLGGGGSGGTMSDTEFWRFCQDIRVIDRVFTRHSVNRIFFLANADSPADAGRHEEETEEVEDEEENPATELIPSEFVECLIRMADAKIGNKMMFDRLDEFMKRFVIPFSCKSETEKFKKDVYTKEVQDTLKRYAKDLTKVFNHYAKNTASGGGGTKKKKKAMSLQDLQAMVKEVGMISLSLDNEAVMSIFQNVMAGSGQDLGTVTLSVQEFFEAIVCLGAFRFPTPFLSLDKKVEMMVTQLIASVKKIAKIGLSEVKAIQMVHVT